MLEGVRVCVCWFEGFRVTKSIEFDRVGPMRTGSPL